MRELKFSALALFLGTLLAFAPDRFLPMLMRSFLVQWVVLFGLLGVFALWKRFWWLGSASVVAGLLVLLHVRAPIGADRMESGSGRVRIAHLNVLQPNRDHEGVIKAARATDADILFFQEVSPEWAAALHAGLDDAYPVSIAEIRTDCYGIAMFGRVPLADVRVEHLLDAPVIRAKVGSGDRAFLVTSMHASSPGHHAAFSRRNAQFAELAERFADEGNEHVLIGDLNTVSWDDALWAFCQRTGLRLQGDAYAATFPAVLGMAMIPIDHVLVSDGLSADKRVFTVPGSDHHGLVTDIIVR